MNPPQPSFEERANKAGHELFCAWVDQNGAKLRANFYVTEKYTVELWGTGFLTGARWGYAEGLKQREVEAAWLRSQLEHCRAQLAEARSRAWDEVIALLRSAVMPGITDAQRPGWWADWLEARWKEKGK